MKRKESHILATILILALFIIGSCKRNVINPDGEGCRKVEDVIGEGYPQAFNPAANWSTGKVVVSVQLAEDEPWQLRAYESDMTTFTVLDEAPIEHVSAWSKGNWIAYYDWDDGGVYRIKPDGTFKERISTSPLGPKLLWHPEEDLLLITNALDLWRVDLDGNLVGDTLRMADSEYDLARYIRPLHWLEDDRIYGRGQGQSNIAYYSLSSQEVVEVFSLTDDLEPATWPTDITALDDNLLVFSNSDGIFLFDLSSCKIETRLLKGCGSQKPLRLSAYDSQHFYMEVSLINQDGIVRRRVFRKNINENSEEELEIF